MIAARYHEPAQVAVLARHPVQRLHARHHRHTRQQIIVTVHQQLGPCTVDRHRLDRSAVRRESTVLGDPPRVEEGECIAVRDAVERHRQVELVGAYAERSAGERDTFGVAGQLELGRGRTERVELDVAIGEDEHPPAVDTPVHPTRHLKNLVRTEMQPREHVAPALDHVGEAGVVDHHGVESTHVERALSGSRHREQERLLDLALEERTDHPDRLATVIERDLHPRVPRPDIRRDFLHAGARRQEDTDAPRIADRLLQEAIVEERDRLLALDLDACRLVRVECARLDHFGSVQISGVERGIHRRREPDEPAPRALSEREAELQFGRRLVDLVDHERVVRADVAVLEPAARDAGGHDHDVPGRRLGRRLALAVHHTDAQRVGGEQRLGDRSHRKCLPRSRPGDDAETLAWSHRRLGKPFRERGQLPAARLPEQRLDVEPETELDRFAGRTGRCDDDDPSPRVPRSHERLMIGRQVRIANRPELRARVAYGRSGFFFAGSGVRFTGGSALRGVVGVGAAVRP